MLYIQRISSPNQSHHKHLACVYEPESQLGMLREVSRVLFVEFALPRLDVPRVVSVSKQASSLKAPHLSPDMPSPDVYESLTDVAVVR